MPQAFHIEEDELIQYALGTLKDATLTTLTAHVSLCNECRTRLGAIQVDLAAYASALPHEGELPEGARQRFLAKLTAPGTQESRLEQARDQSRTGAFTKGLKEWFAAPVALWTLSGVLAAAVAFLAYDDLGRIHQNRQMVPEMSRLAQENAEFEELKQFLRGNDTQQVTLHTSVSPSYAPSGHATYKPITGQMVFTAANMPQLQPGKAYELWLLPASGAAPVPAGT
ncbi:MAG TPA: anti-sigma factor, partial [Acidobacteriaceae bacterium]|nr:anti-sigma factor [Acidobacteriaceae bacterium]